MARTNVKIRAGNSLKRYAFRQKKIPFELPAEKKSIMDGIVIPNGEENDSFYSGPNIRWLRESIKQGKEGKFVVKTWEELKAMEA